jgi:hypothetical protein
MRQARALIRRNGTPPPSSRRTVRSAPARAPALISDAFRAHELLRLMDEATMATGATSAAESALFVAGCGLTGAMGMLIPAELWLAHASRSGTLDMRRVWKDG